MEFHHPPTGDSMQSDQPGFSAGIDILYRAVYNKYIVIDCEVWAKRFRPGGRNGISAPKAMDVSVAEEKKSRKERLHCIGSKKGRITSCRSRYIFRKK